jgi:beta-glucosidase
MTDSRRRFDDRFVFGAATAAFQIEGAAWTDGRTDSIWDTFCRTPGAVINGDDGSVACDHYHRYDQDVAMMASLGLQSYRFSTSWSRVQPDGGPVNQRGLDFYSRLVDSLLEQGVMPWLTLYHWDLPQAIEDTGGWRNRDTAFKFRDYAMHVYDGLGDRVPVWTTLNEPWCAAFVGHTAGAHAPGMQDPGAGLAAMHHLLLGHGLTVQALRQANPALTAGITLNLTVAKPVDPNRAEDVDAARRIDGQMNRIFLDPLFRAEYPADVLDDVAGLRLEDHVHEGDLQIIASPMDALGVNYYHGESVSDRPSPTLVEGEAPTNRTTRSPFPAADGVHSHSQHLPTTVMGWEIQPDGLRELLVRVHRDYAEPAGVDLYVTENGAAFDDRLADDGAVHDNERVDFLHAHLTAILDAVDEGVPVRGYFYWSLMDNFEWAWGYEKRFGIVRVDYGSQQRTVKDSGRAYAGIIRARSMAVEHTHRAPLPV